MFGAIAGAILTGASGGKIADGINTTAGAATACGETVGTTAGAETVVERVKVAGGAIVTLAGGTLGTTTDEHGTVGTMTGVGIIDRIIDVGHATLAGGETNNCQISTRSAVAPNARVNFGYSRSHNRKP